MAARREGVFVSYAREDERWALWIGNQMMTLGFDVELDKWSWRGGDDFVARMNAALAKANVVVSIWSKSYFRHERWSLNEATAALCLTKSTAKRLIPIVVESAEIPPLLKSLVTINLVGLRENVAIESLCRGLGIRGGSVELGPVQPADSSQSGSVHITFPGPGNPDFSPIRTRILLPPNIESQIETTVAESSALLNELSQGDTESIYIEQASADVSDLARVYNWTPPDQILSRGREIRRRIFGELRRNRNPAQLRDLFLVAARIQGVLSYATLDLGHSKASADIARSALFLADRAGHNEAIAWIRGTQALIARYDNRDVEALEFIEKGLRLGAGGSALARLHSGAAHSYAKFGDLERTKLHLQNSENVIDDDSPLRSTPDGIFYFPRAKLHYYAGSSLLQLGGTDLAHEAEKESLLAIELFHEGSDDVRSYSDELLAHIHLATERFRARKIDEILPALEPILKASPEFRTSWHRWWLGRLITALKHGEYRGSDIAAQITEEIERFKNEYNMRASVDDENT